MQTSLKYDVIVRQIFVMGLHTQVIIILFVPAVSYYVRVFIFQHMCPDYEFFRHLVHYIRAKCSPIALQPYNPDATKAAKNTVGKSSDETTLVPPDGLDPVILECLTMLAFISRKARYAGYHLGKLLLPHLLKPIELFPQYLQGRGVHFTTNLLTKKVSFS